MALAVTACLWVVATPETESLRRGLLPLTATCSVLLDRRRAVAERVRSPRSLASRPLRWLGGISYAVYLVHWPVIVMADRLTTAARRAAPLPSSRSPWRSPSSAPSSSSTRSPAAASSGGRCARRHGDARHRQPSLPSSTAGDTVGGAARRPGGRSSGWRRRRGAGSATPPAGRHLRRLRRSLAAARPRRHGGHAGVRTRPVGGRPRVRNRPVAVAAARSARGLRRPGRSGSPPRQRPTVPTRR